MDSVCPPKCSSDLGITTFWTRQIYSGFGSIGIVRIFLFAVTSWYRHFTSWSWIMIRPTSHPYRDRDDLFTATNRNINAAQLKQTNSLWKTCSFDKGKMYSKISTNQDCDNIPHRWRLSSSHWQLSTTQDMRTSVDAESSGLSVCCLRRHAISYELSSCWSYTHTKHTELIKNT